jgi:hypothetical protein
MVCIRPSPSGAAAREPEQIVDPGILNGVSQDHSTLDGPTAGLPPFAMIPASQGVSQ